MKDLFTETEEGFSAFMSDLEGNLTGRIRLQSGKEFANLRMFMMNCKPHRDEEGDLAYWTYPIANGKTVTIFNT